LNDGVIKEMSQYHKTEVAGVMVGENMGVLQKHLATPNAQATEVIRKVYQPLFFVTNDIFGEAQVKLLCDKRRLNKLNKTMGTRLLPKNLQSHVENDAMTEDGKPVVFCCLLDIARLVRFNMGLTVKNRTGKVVCFDFQKEILSEYLGEKVEFINLDFEKFKGIYFKKLGN